ncbi:MAG: 2,3,4,5-tetrahydropyridine-2,6-dicarboxylate N-succinyltransferase [Proteobacteria bacterium]|nr:2,3,4,5-tetrahydropyridine-2,6-dicarboxylate N-succinyltransferase [Pseudomonadota bacterium]
MKDLIDNINRISALNSDEFKKEMNNIRTVFEEFITLLDSGEIRAAEKTGGVWEVNAWVKRGILTGFRLGKFTDMSEGAFTFFDKDTYPLKDLTVENGVRIVPGGTTFRKGSFVAPGVVVMPPSYVNVGAFVDSGTMLDSHSLIGSCAQIGKKCHISAGTQIGGVLEPIQALPVIIEDNVFLGGNCGIFEGVRIGQNAILGSGTVITSSTPVYDIVNERVIKANENGVIAIPENAVVVPGSRQINNEYAKGLNLSLYTPIIIKYRDERSNKKSTLEENLRLI